MDTSSRALVLAAVIGFLIVFILNCLTPGAADWWTIWLPSYIPWVGLFIAWLVLSFKKGKR